MKLGFDEKDRAASINAGPSQSQIKQDLLNNMDVYRNNKVVSYDSKNLFKKSGVAIAKSSPINKGLYNSHNLNNKVMPSRNEQSTNSQTYKWTIPKYDI